LIRNLPTIGPSLPAAKSGPPNAVGSELAGEFGTPAAYKDDYKTIDFIAHTFT
jgi:hypothetical protein